MSRFISILATAVALLVLSTEASAAIILLKGDAPPVKGTIIGQTDAEVVVAVPKPDGTTEPRAIPRAQIDDILHTVSPDRLKALDPRQPKDYRNYAEELAEKREDPEARNEALRLFLIAAWLDGKNLGRSSLLGMIALARSPAEERKLRAMAYLIDPEHDPAVLKAAGTTPPSELPPMPAVGPMPMGIPGDGTGTDVAIAAMRLYRQGKSREAAAKIKQPGGADQLARLKPPFTYEEFLAACATRDAVTTDPLFAQILALETRAAATTMGDTKPLPEPEAGAWSRAAARGRPKPAPSLTLETILEFDPRANLYRDGSWRRG